jgi:hypothetical protein
VELNKDGIQVDTLKEDFKKLGENINSSIRNFQSIRSMSMKKVHQFQEVPSLRKQNSPGGIKQIVPINNDKV